MLDEKLEDIDKGMKDLKRKVDENEERNKGAQEDLNRRLEDMEKEIMTNRKSVQDQLVDRKVKVNQPGGRKGPHNQFKGRSDSKTVDKDKSGWAKDIQKELHDSKNSC